MKYLVITLLFAATYAHHDGQHHLVAVSRLNEIADHVNSKADSTWQAQKFDPSMEDDHVNTIMRTGLLEGEPVGHADDADERANHCEDNGLPKEFDLRKEHPECASVIGHIYDQGNCGSCWAVSTVSAFSDRVCIATKGKIKSLFSGQQMLSCCHKCVGRTKEGKYNGCNGGWPSAAWSYIKRNGITTGGDYKSKQGCQPYLHQHCEHHINGTYATCSTLPKENAEKCRLHCYNHSYQKTFRQDKIKAAKYYSVAPCAAMHEIYHHGTIIAEIGVWEDFFTYKSGVYQYVTGAKKGKHAVRVIGWGEENGVPYWIVANSWNNHWGDNGIIKVKRGSNEIWIEDALSAVQPAVGQK